jgi:Zn-dependent protease
MIYLLKWFQPIFDGMGLGLAAIFLHEAAHAAASRLLGLKVQRLGINTKGVFTIRESGSPHQNLVVALAGPVMNLLLCVLWIWMPVFGLANLVCAITNLVPSAATDGGRALSFWRQSRIAGRDLR